MLLQLENTSHANLQKLMDYAHQLNLNLSLVDDNSDNPGLPGRPLSEAELTQLIERNRKTETISMEAAHSLLRKSFNADQL